MVRQSLRDRAPLLLDRISLTVAPGEIVGLTGPSGRGKSTLGRILAGQVRPETGSITVDGGRLGKGLRPVQYLHQSPIHAVDPRWRLGRIVEEAWAPDDATREAFGVARSWYDRYPHEISGGELQRVVLLRALAPSVRYHISDEISAALDPVTQADIWHALKLRATLGLGILAISHSRILLHRIASRTKVI
jgi:peptide/nickel transport system ATP-binding protein